MTEKAKGGWELVGKLAVVVGLLVGALQLFDWARGRSGLEADGDVSVFSLPDSVHAALRQEVIESKASLKPDTTAAAQKAYADQQARTALLDDVLSARVYLSINVRNNGNKEIKDAVAIIPSSGVYRIEGDDVQRSSGEYSGSVKLGTLRPSTGLILSVWVRSDYVVRSRVRITHPEGAIAVTFPEHVTGILAWASRNSFSIVVITVGLIGILFTAYLSTRSQRPAYESTDPPTPVERESPPPS